MQQPACSEVSTRALFVDDLLPPPTWLNIIPHCDSRCILSLSLSSVMRDRLVDILACFV